MKLNDKKRADKTNHNPTFDQSKLVDLDSHMQGLIDSGNEKIIEYCIGTKNGIIHQQSLGHLDQSKQIPIPDNAIYRIYSMTKPMVSVVAMTMIEDGLFALDDPIDKYVPKFRTVKVLAIDSDGNEQLAPLTRPIEIYDLLTHTSGISNHFHNTPVKRHYQKAGVNSYCNLPRLICLA